MKLCSFCIPKYNEDGNINRINACGMCQNIFFVWYYFNFVGRWTRSFWFLPYFHNMPFSVSFQHFLLLLLSSSAWLNDPQCCSIGLFLYIIIIHKEYIIGQSIVVLWFQRYFTELNVFVRLCVQC